MLKPNKIRPYLVLLLLLPCLAIYLCYRSPKTLVSEVFIQLFSVDTHQQLVQYVKYNFPLPGWVIFALPEALWIFCISYFSGAYYLVSKGVKLIYLPLFLVFWFEVLQALHWLNGCFDWADLLLATLAWGFAYRLRPDDELQDLFKPLNFYKWLCIGLYAVVYLAHVLE